MPYNKPQVTIDLDEYNDLKAKIAETETSDYYKAAQVIAWAATLSGMHLQGFKDCLIRKGVYISVQQSFNGTPNPEDITIKIDK